MTPERMAMVTKIVDKVSWWYARRVWWMDQLELAQEAWTVALGCTDIESDDHFRAYVYRATSRHLSRYCWKGSSPVSSSKAGKHLADIRATPYEKVEAMQAMSQPHIRNLAHKHYNLPDDALMADPEMELLRQEAAMLVPHFQQQLRQRIMQIAGKESPTIRGVVLVLVDGLQSREAARETGVDVKQIYRATEWLKAAVVEDQTARLLLANIEARRADL